MIRQGLVLYPSLVVSCGLIYEKLFHFLQLRKYFGDGLLKNCCGSSVAQQMQRSYRKMEFIYGMAMHPRTTLIVLVWKTKMRSLSQILMAQKLGMILKKS